VHGGNFVSVQSIVGTLRVKAARHEADSSHIMQRLRMEDATPPPSHMPCDMHSVSFAFTFRSFHRQAHECSEKCVYTFDANHAKRIRDSDTILLLFVRIMLSDKWHHCNY
jgi:hypothetical protein